ncbi:hypothetical protein [uncultured Fusobacterium sp.]|nr:hypothetical protein [uncultured Fusobacterium sp.]
MKIKNKVISSIFLLIIIFLFNACTKISLKPFNITYGYSDCIYGIIEDNKINRMEIPKNDIDKINKVVNKEYGIRFQRKYNTVVAPKMYNKDYDINTEFGKKQYIKFYDDIKVIIANKEFIIPKEKIVLNEIEKGAIFYEYPAPIDIINSSYNDVIVDLGTIEIYDETGKIQRTKRKIPSFLIKKVYLTLCVSNSFVGAGEKILYRGWAEDCPIELQKQK